MATPAMTTTQFATSTNSERPRWVPLVVAILFIGSAIFAIGPSFVPVAAQVTVGQRAPLVKASPLHGRSSLDGTFLSVGPTVLTLWATWCRECQNELRLLEHLRTAYAAKGVRVVALSIDSPLDSGSIMSEVRAAGGTYDVLGDASGKAMASFGMRGVPATVVIDAGGVVRFVQLGTIKRRYAELTATVDTLLHLPRR